VESFFRDYRDVGGLQFAFEIDSGTSAEEINQKILIDKIEIDPEISDSRFFKPVPPPVPSPAPVRDETRPADPPAASLAAPVAAPSH
jgi:hypothetical protein